MRWADIMGAEDWEAHIALAWLDDLSLEPELRDALIACLTEKTSAWWGQVIADIGGEELSWLLFQQAQRLMRERSVARLLELRSMPYRQYLQTPEWQERASATYARFNGRCAVCNGEGDLEAHHRTYERRGAEEPADLTALCPACHGLFHEWRDLDSAPSLG